MICTHHMKFNEAVLMYSSFVKDIFFLVHEIFQHVRPPNFEWLQSFFSFSILTLVIKQGVAGHMFRTEPVIAENRFTKITIGDNQKSLWPFLNKIQGVTGDKVWELEINTSWHQLNSAKGMPVPRGRLLLLYFVRVYC